LPGYHFSGISGNMEMSGNLAKVSEKLGKRPKVRERSGMCVVREHEDEFIQPQQQQCR